MYHEKEASGLCLYCHKWCELCNQCGCEIGRKKICPGFDVKKDPYRFEMWEIEQRVERLWQAQLWGKPKAGFSGAQRARWFNKKREELLAERDDPHFRKDKDGKAYYDS